MPEIALERSRGARRQTRRLLVAGLVVAAAVTGSVGTHWFEPRAGASTPTWTAACEDAIDATARLQRLQATQMAQGMEEAFGLVAGARVANPTPIDAPLTARLQRVADDATSRCVSPESSNG